MASRTNTSAPSGFLFLSLARRTLSRDFDDARPIPPYYLEALSVHLANHPNEDNFIVDLDDQGGILTCLDCYVEVPLAMNRELKDFRAFWDHLATPGHNLAAADRKANISPGDSPDNPMEVDMWENPHPAVPSGGMALPPPRRTQKKSVRRRVPLSDGEYYEYDSTTDEEILGLTTWEAKPPSSSAIASSSQTYPTHTNNNNNNNNHNNMYNPQVQHNLYSNTPNWWETPTAKWPEAVTTTSSNGTSSTSTSSPLLPVKRGRRGVRRIEYDDGDVIYISTDDENVDETFGGAKRPCTSNGHPYAPPSSSSSTLTSSLQNYNRNQWDSPPSAHRTVSNGAGDNNAHSYTAQSSSYPYSSHGSVAHSHTSVSQAQTNGSASASGKSGIRLGGGLMKVNGVKTIRHANSNAAATPARPSQFHGALPASASGSSSTAGAYFAGAQVQGQAISGYAPAQSGSHPASASSGSISGPHAIANNVQDNHSFVPPMPGGLYEDYKFEDDDAWGGPWENQNQNVVNHSWYDDNDVANGNVNGQGHGLEYANVNAQGQAHVPAAPHGIGMDYHVPPPIDGAGVGAGANGGFGGGVDNAMDVGGGGVYADPAFSGYNVPGRRDGMAGYDVRPIAKSFEGGHFDEMTMSSLDVVEDPRAHLKDFFASTLEALQEAPTITDAAKRLGLSSPTAMLPYLEVTLMPHQVIGVDWMVKQEKKKNKGGILADDMGLGKTLQCIAVCTLNHPLPNAERRTTLIVAPTALLDQWKREIEQRTTAGKYKVYIHHGNTKLKSTVEVKNHDFVITTYATLCMDFPKAKKKEKKNEQGGQEEAAAAADNEDSDYENNEDLWGPLAKTRWHRIVLDEAQCIRNRVTRSSKCMARLHATYRWVLTGTPVTNTLADLYSLMRFLHLPPWSDWREYKLRIAKVESRNPSLAGHRAQVMLKEVLLRRNKDTTVEGRRILELPPKSVEVVEIEFSAEERRIYDAIETRQQQKMSKYLRTGTVMKNYAAILVMLLRLRQACNHPHLLLAQDYEDGERILDENAGFGDTSPAAELQRAERLCGAQFVQDAKAKFLDQARARILSEDAAEEDTDCPICFDPYVNNCRITSCKHLFCGDCLNDLFKSPPTGLHAEDDAYAKAMQTGQRSCPVCRRDIFPDKTFKSTPFEPTEEELNALRGVNGEVSSPEVASSSDVKGKGKATSTDEAAIDEILHHLEKEDKFEPSAKMVKMMEYIRQWRTSAPDDKIICYSQWTSMITLVERLLARDNIETVRFDGKMTRIARDNAISKFKRRNGPPIMLISLKCGGVGLNLVEANRVLSLDLAWNSATENQAFDRVHRMGQQKDVFVKRLIVSKTVEERILNLQAKKQALADAALGEGSGKKIKRMTVAELKALFGM